MYPRLFTRSPCFNSVTHDEHPSGLVLRPFCVKSRSACPDPAVPGTLIGEGPFRARRY